MLIGIVLGEESESSDVAGGYNITGCNREADRKGRVGPALSNKLGFEAYPVFPEHLPIMQLYTLAITLDSMLGPLGLIRVFTLSCQVLAKQFSKYLINSFSFFLLSFFCLLSFLLPFPPISLLPYKK